MYRSIVVLALLLTLLSGSAAQAEGGGLKPSEAPIIGVSQHYFGDTNHAQNDTKAPFGRTWDLWRLPPLIAEDVVTIAWNNANRNVGLCMAQNVDDYSWAEATCNSSPSSNSTFGGFTAAFVSGSGSERTRIEARHSSSESYLEFVGCEGGCSDETDAGLPNAYDFTVETIQHAIGVDLLPAAGTSATGVLNGSAVLANGTPVPDGLSFTLTASWPHQTARYVSTSASGKLGFRLSLPASARGRTVSFTIERNEDPEYLAAKSATQKVHINTQSVRPACVVPHLGRNRRLGSVERSIRAAHCAIGAIRHVHSRRWRRGAVVALTPRSGAHLMHASRVVVVVSSGSPVRRRHHQRHGRQAAR